MNPENQDPKVVDAALPRRRVDGRFEARPVRVRRIVAVGGGKGGIGKSLISANLGIELARRGHSVVLLDLDLGGANLHTCLGIDHPKETLSDFVERRVPSLERLAVPAGVPGLRLISGSLDSLGAANPLYQQKLRLMRAVNDLDADVAILDLGAGSHFNVLDFFLLADDGVVTVVPEPTSVENAYRFLKAALFRRLKAAQAVHGVSWGIEEAIKAGGTASPMQLLESVRARDAELGALLEREMRAFHPRILVNSVREAADLNLGEGICAAWRRFFGLELTYLGYLRHDPDAWRAGRARRPLLLERQDQPIAEDVAAIADKLLALPVRRES
ncbi:MAG TPA: P-loop NTPase [Vulgatibacter sp.]|nr:P-loop NTPase [Vulgatibacter sp.]